MEISEITMNSAWGKQLFKQTCQESERQFRVIHSCAVSQVTWEGIWNIWKANTINLLYRKKKKKNVLHSSFVEKHEIWSKDSTLPSIQWSTGVNPFSVLYKMPAQENNLWGIKCKWTVNLEMKIEITSWKIMWIETARNMQNQLTSMNLHLSNLATNFPPKSKNPLNSIQSGFRASTGEWTLASLWL